MAASSALTVLLFSVVLCTHGAEQRPPRGRHSKRDTTASIFSFFSNVEQRLTALEARRDKSTKEPLAQLEAEMKGEVEDKLQTVQENLQVVQEGMQRLESKVSELLNSRLRVTEQRVAEMVQAKANTTEERLASLEATKAESSPAVCRYQFQYQYEKEAPRHSGDNQRVAKLEAELSRLLEKVSALDKRLQDNDQSVGSLHNASVLAMEGMLHKVTELAVASEQVVKSTMKNATEFLYDSTASMMRDAEARLLAGVESSTALLNSGDHQCVAKLEAELSRLLEKVSALDKRLQDNDQSVGSLHNASVLAMEGVLHTVTELVAASEQVVKSIAGVDQTTNKLETRMSLRMEEVCGRPLRKTCQDYYNDGRRISGVYRLQLEVGLDPMEVYCDMSNGPGWVVFQRRKDGSVDFYRDWKSYEDGFGDFFGEFWLGNRKIHRLTGAGLTQLRVDLQAWNDSTAHASYSNFRVGDASSFYTLSVSGYSGNAGDGLAWHNGMKFSTHDKDNDVHSGNCAKWHRGGWWYNACHESNLNGEYGTRDSSDSKYVAWYYWFRNYQSLRRTEMKVK